MRKTDDHGKPVQTSVPEPRPAPEARPAPELRTEPAAADERTARRAALLRANLKRRKAQTRGREAGEAEWERGAEAADDTESDKAAR